MSSLVLLLQFVISPSLFTHLVGLFTDGFFRIADHLLNFADILFHVARDFQVRIIRYLPGHFLDLAFHFVDFAFGLVSRTGLHHGFLSARKQKSVDDSTLSRVPVSRFTGPEEWSELLVLETLLRPATRGCRVNRKVSDSAQHYRSQ